MYKFAFVIATIVVLGVSAAPKPKPGVLAAYAAAPVAAVAPAVVTAQSSQVVARNYNALAAPLVAAAPFAAYSAAPVVAAASPAAYAYPYASPYIAAPAAPAYYI